MAREDLEVQSSTSIPNTVVASNGNGEEPAPDPVPIAAISVRSVALSVLAVLGLVFLLRYAQDLFIPVVLAILIAYALHPVVTWLTWLRIPRVIAAAIVVFGLLAGVGLGSYALRGQAVNAIENLSEAAKKLRQAMREIRQQPAGATSAMSKIKQAANEVEKTAAEAAGGSEEVRRG